MSVILLPKIPCPNCRIEKNTMVDLGNDTMQCLSCLHECPIEPDTETNESPYKEFFTLNTLTNITLEEGGLVVLKVSNVLIINKETGQYEPKHFEFEWNFNYEESLELDLAGINALGRAIQDNKKYIIGTVNNGGLFKEDTKIKIFVSSWSKKPNEYSTNGYIELA